MADYISRFTGQQIDDRLGAVPNKQDAISDLDTIRTGAGKGMTAVQPSALNGKQNTIGDLQTIREGAAAGATAVQPSRLKTVNGYSLIGEGNIVIPVGSSSGGGFTEESDPTVPQVVKNITAEKINEWNNKGTYSMPEGGIPATDFTQSVQTILNNAITQYATRANWTTSPYPLKATDIYAILETAFGNVYIKPNNGIPLTDLAQAVQTKINGALQEEQFLDFLEALNDITAELMALNPYVLPEGGIPATDLDTSVQASLTKADNALTSHQSIKTINGQSLVGTGNITLETGGQVTVDTQMSSTSTNPVQNKVIKGYVDDSLEGVEDLVDAVLGTPSGAVDVTHFTVGSGLEVVNGVLQCSFVPTRYYTGSSAPINSQGNNGDLYFQLD